MIIEAEPVVAPSDLIAWIASQLFWVFATLWQLFFQINLTVNMHCKGGMLADSLVDHDAQKSKFASSHRL